eukprot:jgi/Botrbrau1/17414/Bobra.0054s0010.1
MYDFEKPTRHKSLFRDRVFTADDWQWQKSWKRHLPDGTFWWVFLGIWRWVVYFTLIAFIICCYHQWLVPLGAPDWPGANYASTWQVFNLTAFALSLLMVFKTNSSYARWWEARTTWGYVFNAVRNMARRAIADIGEEHAEALAMFVRWCAALPYLLKDHVTLRTSAQLNELLKPEEMEWVGSWSHKPHGGAAVLSRILRQVSMPEYAMLAVDEQILSYVNLVGACERINRTAIPQAYTRHMSRFLNALANLLPVHFVAYLQMGLSTRHDCCIVPADWHRKHWHPNRGALLQSAHGFVLQVTVCECTGDVRQAQGDQRLCGGSHCFGQQVLQESLR